MKEKEEEKDHTTDEYVEAIKQLVERAGFDSFLIILIKDDEVNGIIRKSADEIAGGDIRDIAIVLNTLLERNPLIKVAMIMATETVDNLSVTEVPL